ncbi:MAG: DedA family protein [Caulobacteraceae bacterium]
MFNLIVGVIQKSGVVGVGLLMLLENVIPIIPSELIMPMAGYEAAKGAFSPMAAILAGTVGSIVGGTVWYGIGRQLGLERLKRWADGGGRWITLSPDEVTRGHAWFQRWGPAAVCIGRALPGVRGVICIPAGIARMPFWPFLLWSSLGALIWTTLLVLAGYGLNAEYRLVEHWLNPVTDGFVALCLIVYAVRVARYRSRRSIE